MLTSSATMGRKIVAVATLLVTSVMPAVIIESKMTNDHVGREVSTLNVSPMIWDKPDSLIRHE
jgi:hypothetical protein